MDPAPGHEVDVGRMAMTSGCSVDQAIFTRTCAEDNANTDDQQGVIRASATA